ncbi:Uu.00g135260.m01.CDS01 [Anthostomella pinea]|uniref:Uu.00g135260.m01.CDS01 n=1 Tax=Anthostomella pinea TaxID=933095 RepID=A0AAI8VP26_9PEZI|nr:Uu.00g135260.m01.CDS01 [Anthostomella pinea]
MSFDMESAPVAGSKMPANAPPRSESSLGSKTGNRICDRTHAGSGPKVHDSDALLASTDSRASSEIPEGHGDAASYAKSGFANRMGWGQRPVLLLIDVCKAYWTPGSPLDCSAHAPTTKCPQVMRDMLTAARATGTPVVWTAVEYTDPDMKDAGLFWLKAKALNIWNVAGTRGLSDWVEGLVPEKGEMVIKKKYASAFFGTSLATDLRVMGADTVVVCGVSTSGCVRASTLDAMQCGYRPMVVGSACGDRSDEIQNANLFDLNAKYADVVSEQEAIEHLKAGWPKS